MVEMVGWLLVGCWLVVGWLLVGCWLVYVIGIYIYIIYV